MCEKHAQRYVEISTLLIIFYLTRVISTSSDRKATLYDPDDLTFFRDALLDGSLTDHLHSKLGTASDNVNQEELTFRSPSYFKPALNPKIKTNGVDKDGCGSESNTKDGVEDVAVSGEGAVPVLNGGSSDVSDDHTSSGSSNTITSKVRKALSEGITGSDQGSRKHPRCDSSATAHTIKPSCYALSPPAQALRKKRTTMPPLDSQKPATTAPAAQVKYTHDPKAGCIYSASPTMQVLDRDVIRALNSQKLRLLAHLREQYDAGWGSEPDLKQKHAVILEDVQASNFEKALYFKRCNGEYVNAIGERYPSQVVMQLVEQEVELASKTEEKRQDETLGAKMDWWTKTDGRKSDRGRLKVECDNAVRAWRSAANEAPQLEASTQSRSADEDNDSSVGDENHKSNQVAVPRVLNLAPSQDPQRAQASEQNHRALPSSKPSLSRTHDINPDEISIPDDLSSTSKAPEDEQRTTNNAALVLQQQQQQHPTQRQAHPSKPKIKIPLTMLLAREELMKSGKVSVEDIIVTCWAMNFQKDSQKGSS